jgi:excinuclease ABC subunit A
VIADADWIVDLGPEGGDQGGRVVAAGSPARLAGGARPSHTALALREFLEDRETKTEAKLRPETA